MWLYLKLKSSQEIIDTNTCTTARLYIDIYVVWVSLNSLCDLSEILMVFQPQMLSITWLDRNLSKSLRNTERILWPIKSLMLSCLPVMSLGGSTPRRSLLTSSKTLWMGKNYRKYRTVSGHDVNIKWLWN